MYYKAHEMLKKVQREQYKTILEKWYDDDKYRKYLSDVGWNEEGIIQHDKIASNDHSYTVTKEEGSRNENSLNAEGVTRTIESAQ